MIVDDFIDHAQTLARLLELIGHEVRAAYGAAEALTLAEQFRSEMILADINMPNMDGYESISTRRVSGRLVVC